MSEKSPAESWVRLFFSFCVLLFVPSLYSTIIRPHFFLSIPDTNTLDILGNLEWFDLVFESFSAFLILPLYYLFAHALSLGKNPLRKIATQAFCVVAVTATAFLVVVVSSLHLFADLMGTSYNALFFLRLESVALIGKVLVSFFMVLLVVVGSSWMTLLVAGIQFVLFLISDMKIILSFGIVGVAVSDIIVQWGTVIPCLIFFSMKGYLFGRGLFSNFAGLTSWVSQGAASGFGVVISNIAYTTVIARSVNMLGGGEYWLANEYFWGLFLIPILALNEIVKHDCSGRLYWKRYFCVIAGTIVFWGVLLFGCRAIPGFLPGDVFWLLLLFSGAYIPYCLDAVLSGVFSGYGRLDLSLLSSIVTNCFYYGGLFWFLFRQDPLDSVEAVVLVFAGGILLTTLVDLILFRWFLKKKVRIETRKRRRLQAYDKQDPYRS